MPMNSLFRKNLNFSALDNDFYKLNMWQCFMHQYPYIEDAEYKFVVRSDVDLRPYRQDIEAELAKLDGLQFTEEEIRWVEQFSWYTKDFIEWLRLWSYQSRFLHISEENNQLAIHARGPLMHVHNFEMPVLSTVAEVYNRYNHADKTIEDVLHCFNESLPRKAKVVLRLQVYCGIPETNLMPRRNMEKLVSD